MNISQRFEATPTETERRAASAVFVIGVAFALAMVIGSSGCVPAEAITQAKKEQAIALGYTKAPGATPTIRKIGEAEYDAWSAQRYALEGERLPEAVADRLEARGELPEGYRR